jgi:transcriptional regulator of acetoin/glycerol metabolism
VLRAAVSDLLERCAWPGNVRQLENTIQRLVLLAGDGPITPEVVESDRGLREMLTGSGTAASPVLSLKQTEKDKIRQALDAVGGNRLRAARMLGISRATIFRKIKQYDLS